MFRNARPLSFLLLLVAAVAQAQTIAPPVAKKVPHVLTLHGDKLVDEYQWMRKKGARDVETYLRAEAGYADAMMKPTAALQERLYQEMVARIQEDDADPPWQYGPWMYYTRTEKGKQHEIYCRKPAAGGAEAVLIDPNELAKHNKFVAVRSFEPTFAGDKLAYATDLTGFRQYTLAIQDLKTGATLPEHMPRVTSVAWAADDQTLFYSVEDPVSKRSHRVYRHTLGTPVARDVVIYDEKDERFSVSVELTRSRAYLLIESSSLTASETRYLRADQPNGTFRVIKPRAADLEYHVDHRGDRFYIMTNDQGRNYRLVTAPVDAPATWTEIMPHRPDVMLESVSLFANWMVLGEREKALPRLRVIDLRTNQAHVVPASEPVYQIEGVENTMFETDVLRYTYESFTTPTSIYDYDMIRRSATLVKREPVLGGFDPARYQSERISARAPDGVEVPISLVYKKGVPLDGTAPLLLEGYGAYGSPYDVTFSSTLLSLLDRGVIYAVAHIRGGGDLGKHWHDDGRMLHKRNTFTDFIASAETLIARKYTSREHLAIEGASAGGLLMGAVTNLRPELFKVVIAGVPFVDVINTMLDVRLPLTVGEFEEWGNPKERAQYEYMKSYSPYDNVARKDYPTMLVRSSYNDSQVMYWEPAKWVARLRALKTDHNPLLFKIDLEPAGHGGKSGRYEQLHEIAFDFAFLLTQLGVER